MARSDNSKSRQAALWQIFQRHSDDQHGLTMTDILSYLERDYDIQTTRQSIAGDFLMLDTVLHIYIEADNSVRPARYYWKNRPLTAPDIEQLAESALTSPLLTIEQAQTLISKLKTQCSDYTARHIVAKADITKQKKDLSEPTIQMLSTFREAIENNAPVYIQYKTQMFCRAAHSEIRETEYEIYPYEILFPDDRPAVLAQTKPFREGTESNDKGPGFKLFFFDYITEVSTKPREAEHRTKDNSLYSNKAERITLQCSLSVMPLIYERFGTDITVDRITDETCRIAADAIITPELFGWLFSFGENVKLLTPLHATQRMKQWLKALYCAYGI